MSIEVPNLLFQLKRRSKHRDKRSVCKPHSEFNVDCNPCKCAANGLSYTCTHNECLEGENTNKEDVEVFMETEVNKTVTSHLGIDSSEYRWAVGAESLSEETMHRKA